MSELRWKYKWEKRIEIYYLVGILLLFGLVIATEYNTFTNGLTEENVTFEGDRNFTRNFTLSKDATVTVATLNLTGYRGDWRSFDNNTDVTCGTGSCSAPHVTVDNDLTSSSYCGSGDFYKSGLVFCSQEYNYSVPEQSELDGTTKAKIVLYGSCLTDADYMLDITWRSLSFDSNQYQSRGLSLNDEEIQCINNDQGTNIIAVLDINEDIDTNLEASIRIIRTGGASTLVSIRELRVLFYNSTDETWGDYLGNYNTNDASSRFDLFVNNTAIFSNDEIINFTDNKTNDFSSTLNTAINGGACDCTDCTLLENACTINLTFDNFHLYDYGILEYSDINITWSESIIPNNTITEPIGEKDSTEISFNVSATDNYLLDTCLYWVERGASIEVANTSITCSSETTGTFFVASIGTNYSFHFFIEDVSGNINKTSTNFSTSSGAEIVLPPFGGGGGGGSTTIITGINGANWTMLTDRGGTSYDFSVLVGASRTKGLLFENLGDTSLGIDLSCLDEEGNLCQYVTFEDDSFQLPLVKGIKINKPFIVSPPGDFPKGTYIINTIATDEDGNRGVITSVIEVSGLTPITFFIKLGSNLGPIPYWLIFIFSIVLIGIIARFTIFIKLENFGGALSFLVGLIGGVILIIIL